MQPTSQVQTVQTYSNDDSHRLDSALTTTAKTAFHKTQHTPQGRKFHGGKGGHVPSKMSNGGR